MSEQHECGISTQQDSQWPDFYQIWHLISLIYNSTIQNSIKFRHFSKIWYIVWIIGRCICWVMNLKPLLYQIWSPSFYTAWFHISWLVIFTDEKQLIRPALMVLTRLTVKNTFKTIKDKPYVNISYRTFLSVFSAVFAKVIYSNKLRVFNKPRYTSAMSFIWWLHACHFPKIPIDFLQNIRKYCALWENCYFAWI